MLFPETKLDLYFAVVSEEVCSIFNLFGKYMFFVLYHVGSFLTLNQHV